MLLLENNAKNYKKVIQEKIKLTRKQTQSKYTKDVNLNETLRGWSWKGIKQYSKLISIVQRNRYIVHSKEVEVELMDNYKSICR